MIKFPTWLISKTLTQSCKVIKIKKTEIEDEYGQVMEEKVEYLVKNVEIQPVSSEDLAFIPAGMLNIGDARAFFAEGLTGTDFIADFITPLVYTFDDKEVDISNGEAKLKKNTDGQYPQQSTITPKFYTNFNGEILSFACVEEKPENTSIKYVVSKDNGSTWLWYDGYQWTSSDGTIEQANTSEELRNHLKEFPYTSGQFTIKVFLISDGNNTPTLKNFKIRFGIKLELEDIVEDLTGKQYRIITITDYYVMDKVQIKEVYLRKIAGV